jgi:drug/metabolite transporter (DMT)-like permease
MTPNLRASLLMAGSMSGFTINDAIVKSVGDAINPGQVMLVRGLIMLIFLSVFVRASGTPMPFRAIRSWPLVLRVFGELAATVFFLVALFNMPIANVSAILQSLPLAVTVGAALFLGEPIGIRRLTAIMVGFLGVLIIIHPGLDGFSPYALLVVATVVFATLRDLSTRRLPASIPSLMVTLITTACVAAFGSLLMVFLGGWKPLTWDVFARLAAASVFLFVGYQCIILAIRTGDIHVVAQFRYTSLLWAILLGVVMFGEIPDIVTLFGAAIIVVTGLYTLYRERVVARQAASATISAASSPPARGT